MHFGKNGVMNIPVSERAVVDDRGEDGLLGALLSLVVLAVVVAVVLVLVFKGTSSKSAKKDVTVTACRSNADGKPTASGTIVNHSSKTSNYVIQLAFTDAQGNTVSEGVAPVKSVGVNKTAKWDLTGDRDVNGSVQCNVAGVSRTHLPGQ
jgi:hypothetical protein